MWLRLFVSLCTRFSSTYDSSLDASSLITSTFVSPIPPYLTFPHPFLAPVWSCLVAARRAGSRKPYTYVGRMSHWVREAPQRMGCAHPSSRLRMSFGMHSPYSTSSTWWWPRSLYSNYRETYRLWVAVEMRPTRTSKIGVTRWLVLLRWPTRMFYVMYSISRRASQIHRPASAILATHQPVPRSHVFHSFPLYKSKYILA